VSWVRSAFLVGAAGIFVGHILPASAADNTIASGELVAIGYGERTGPSRALVRRAEQGDPVAQARLGFMYQNGLGVPQAYVAAVDMYIRAAEQGNPTAQYLLGLMFDKGHGVVQDYVIAYKWLNLAASRASKRQSDYYLRLRDAVASKMTRVQIAEGQWLALNWVPKPRWYVLQEPMSPLPYP
jgi:TPR repeat protein